MSLMMLISMPLSTTSQKCRWFLSLLHKAASFRYTEADIYSYAPIWIGLSGLCFLMTILEIIFLTRHKLTPLKFLIHNVIKSTIWAGLFIVDVVGWARSTGRAQTIGALVVEFVIV